MCRKTVDFLFFQNLPGIESDLLKISQLVAFRKVSVLMVCAHWMRLVTPFVLATSVVILFKD